MSSVYLVLKVTQASQVRRDRKVPREKLVKPASSVSPIISTVAMDTNDAAVFCTKTVTDDYLGISSC